MNRKCVSASTDSSGWCCHHKLGAAIAGGSPTEAEGDPGHRGGHVCCAFSAARHRFGDSLRNSFVAFRGICCKNHAGLHVPCLLYLFHEHPFHLRSCRSCVVLLVYLFHKTLPSFRLKDSPSTTADCKPAENPAATQPLLWRYALWAVTPQ